MGAPFWGSTESGFWIAKGQEEGVGFSLTLESDRPGSSLAFSSEIKRT